jgi:hypothetical protein
LKETESTSLRSGSLPASPPVTRVPMIPVSKPSNKQNTS